jgi:hypothetical protein
MSHGSWRRKLANCIIKLKLLEYKIKETATNILIITTNWQNEQCPASHLTD